MIDITITSVVMSTMCLYLLDDASPDETNGCVGDDRVVLIRCWLFEVFVLLCQTKAVAIVVVEHL